MLCYLYVIIHIHYNHLCRIKYSEIPYIEADNNRSTGNNKGKQREQETNRKRTQESLQEHRDVQRLMYRGLYKWYGTETSTEGVQVGGVVALCKWYEIKTPSRRPQEQTTGNRRPAQRAYRLAV